MENDYFGTTRVAVGKRDTIFASLPPLAHSLPATVKDYFDQNQQRMHLVGLANSLFLADHFN